MFSGEGMHSTGDAPTMITELNCNDVVYAGVIGNVAGIEDLVARAVAESLPKGGSMSDCFWRIVLKKSANEP